MSRIRRLLPRDEPDVESFLQEYRESSLFILHNLRFGGMVYSGQRYQAEYFGVYQDGRLLGVAAHTWMNTLILQAPHVEALDALEQELPHLLTRPLTGLLGPRDQCLELLDRLNLDRSTAILDQDEPLYRLDLARLRLPPDAEDPTLIMRAPRPDEHSLLASWRLDYLSEIMQFRASETLAQRGLLEILQAIVEGRAYVLEKRDPLHPTTTPGQIVSYCCFNALAKDGVQLAGLWTPHAFRGHYFGRVVAALALRHARDTLGYRFATVLLDEGNRAALSSCEALRFDRVGRYSFTMWS